MSVDYVQIAFYIYFALEVVWVLFYLVGVLLVELGTSVETYQTAHALNAFHFALVPVVLYSADNGRGQVLLNFAAVCITDLQSVLHASMATQEVSWAYAIRHATASYGMFISIYALMWYMAVITVGYKFRDGRKK
jgi:hypothetical protein